MKKTTFKLMTAFLFYGYCFFIVLIIVAILGLSFLLNPFWIKTGGAGATQTHSTSSGLILGDLAFNDLDKPLIKKTFQVAIDWPDTLIKYDIINKYGRGSGSFTGEELAFSSVEESLQDYTRNNELTKETRLRLKDKTYLPTDTMLSKVEIEILPKFIPSYFPQTYKIWLKSSSDSANHTYPFLVSKPRKIKTQVIFMPKNQDDYGWIIAFNWFKYLIMLVAGINIIWQVGRLLHHFRQEKIFYIPNFQALRWLGLSFLVLWFLGVVESLLFSSIDQEIQGAFYSVVHWHVGNESLQEKIKLNPDSNFDLNLLSSPLVIGLFIIVLAEVFRRGVELQQEQDLTI